MEAQEPQLRPQQKNKYASLYEESNIQKDNKELVDRICKAERSESTRIKSSKSRKFTQLTENLRTVASINRFNKHRVIQQENDRFFNRLVNTSPTLTRQSWMKDLK